MTKIESLLEIIKKIFPNENCTSENIGEYAKRLAIKDFELKDEDFATVEPVQVNQDRSYTPEKIKPNPQARGRHEEPYATFRKMRELGERYGGYMSYYPDDAETFCRQALFMKDFTDNYSEIVLFETHGATYMKMKDVQLRTYFTWRTKVRQGEIEWVPPSYVFCYIFELINDIGVKSPMDAIEKLVALWTSFRQFNHSLDGYLREWIRDYYVDHKSLLPSEFSEYSRHFPVPYHDDMEMLTKVKACRWDDLSVIEASSSFKITNGQFYKSGNQEIIEKCACYTIREIAKIFKIGGVDFRKMFFEYQREKLYSLYRGAVHQKVALSPTVVEIDDSEIIKCNSRGWRREYVNVSQYRTAVGYILKLIEVKMRQHFDYKRKLQAPDISVVKNCFLNSEQRKFRWPNRPSIDKLKVWKGKAFAVISSDSFEEAIVRAISAYCSEDHIAIQGRAVRKVAPIEIDMEKLKEIEREHIETAKKLILEELPMDMPEIPDIPLENAVSVEPSSKIDGMEGLILSLSAEAKHLLSMIFEGGKVLTNSELLVETINEKALEAINDNLIDYAEGVPYIYEEYMDELKLSLGGQ